jgi:hypothetical protein
MEISQAYPFLKEENSSAPHKEFLGIFQIHIHAVHMPRSNGLLVLSPN